MGTGCRGSRVKRPQAAASAPLPTRVPVVRHECTETTEKCGTNRRVNNRSPLCPPNSRSKRQVPHSYAIGPSSHRIKSTAFQCNSAVRNCPPIQPAYIEHDWRRSPTNKISPARGFVKYPPSVELHTGPARRRSIFRTAPTSTDRGRKSGQLPSRIRWPVSTCASSPSQSAVPRGVTSSMANEELNTAFWKFSSALTPPTST